VTALWLALIASLFLTAGGIRAVNPLFGTTNGISVTSMEIMMIVTIIFLIIFAIAYFTGRRGYCHVLCPIAGLMIAGRKIRNLIGWPAVQLDANPSRCIDCGKCSEECPMGLDVHTMVKDGEMENAECIDCANCADTCPKGAITFGLKKK
jgi:polyferredoxin